MSEVRIRPMTVDDAPAAERVTAIGFHELDTRMFRRSWPDPQLRPPHRGANWTDRARHLVGTDPGGCWVAERDDEVIGVVVSFVREKMWLLASYAVVPEAQGLGLGKALLAAALEHGRGCLRGMFNASSDPKALRRYHAAGFRLHPQMFLRGTPDRSQLPVVEHVREGGESDWDWMDSVDRRTRGAAHGPDHRLLTQQFRLVVSETSSAQGYAYLDDGVALLAATDRRTAARLLWEAIASSNDVLVGHITPENSWAVDVGLAARLELHQEGYQALRGMRPPRPYLSHGALM
ncbi:MAG TPA: GNAT family N-acetyltransferase [Nocardioides sp.]|nr:GNAT family N-acetyltransferase [Nocardioides sp.]